MHLIDTHQHLWNVTQFPYSWCAGNSVLNRTFTFADYQAASSGLGITKSIWVEGDVDEPHALPEARSMQTLAEKHPSIAGIVANCRPEQNGFRVHLVELSKLSHVKGVRRVLHTQADDLARSKSFARNLQKLPDFGFTFDLCVLPRQLPSARALVASCPEVTFILDHGGVPDVKARALDPWRDEISRLAAYPNVHCKISGLVAYADPTIWTIDDLRPFVTHLIAAFGWDRLVWGGDWPVCTLTSPLSDWVAVTHELTANATTEQRAAFYHRNAERIYRV